MAAELLTFVLEGYVVVVTGMKETEATSGTVKDKMTSGGTWCARTTCVNDVHYIYIIIYIYMYMYIYVCMYVYIYIDIYLHTGLAARGVPSTPDRRYHAYARLKFARLHLKPRRNPCWFWFRWRNACPHKCACTWARHVRAYVHHTHTCICSSQTCVHMFIIHVHAYM